MKKNLLIVFLFFNLYSHSQSLDTLYVSQNNGVNTVIINSSKNEFVSAIANKYNSSVELLGMFNTLNSDMVFVKESPIQLPLTENNFVKNGKLIKADGTFLPVVYSIQNNEGWKDVCKKFLLPEQQLKQWNISANNEGIKNKVIVGWLKTAEAENESFVKSKTNYLKNLSSLLPKYTVDSTDISVKDALKIEKNERISTWKELAKRAKTISTNILGGEAKDNYNKKMPKHNAKNISTSINNAKDRTTSSINKTLNSTKDFIHKSFTKKEKTKVEVTKPTETTTNNKIIKVDEPNLEIENKVEKQINTSEINNTKIKNTDEIEKGLPITDLAPNEALVKNDNPTVENTINTEIADSAIEEPKEKPSSANTNIDFKQTNKGKVSWFFSGPIGGEYYVFTNLAPKGTLIKVESVFTKKYVVAKVIGTLRADEISTGVILLLSDNAKTILNVKERVFNANISKP